MKINKAGLVNAMGVCGTNARSKHKRVKVCIHQRMVDSHINAKGEPSWNLVCRECGAVIPETGSLNSPIG